VEVHWQREVAHEGHCLDLERFVESFGRHSSLVIRKEQIMENETIEIVELTVEELEERIAPGIVWGGDAG
jgi:hypothetical protein